MTSTASLVTLSPQDYDAVLFDLDGVLTKTASVHSGAWKRLFDGYHLCGRKIMNHLVVRRYFRSIDRYEYGD
jgi:beta-phosphoglucomutase-like phosphatase (HAD superfamily)